jgi:hypothetical protein
MTLFSDPEGPIEEFSWGKFTVLGQVHSDQGDGVGKDIRVIGTDVTEWKERKGHTLRPDMITGVFHKGIEVLVIGIGVDSAIQVSEETRTAIIEHGIDKVLLLPTPKACKKYNSLLHKGLKVALLAHGTC